jgi:hypothetical protein
MPQQPVQPDTDEDLIHVSSSCRPPRQLRSVAPPGCLLPSRAVSFLLLPLFLMKKTFTELALNWNCLCVDAILFAWHPFGGIELAFTYHGRQLPLVRAEREGDCAPPLRAVQGAREGRTRERGSGVRAKGEAMNAQKWLFLIEHTFRKYVLVLGPAGPSTNTTPGGTQRRHSQTTLCQRVKRTHSR